MLLDVLETAGLTQLHDAPFYVSQNSNATFLDLVRTNNPTLSYRCTVKSSLPGSDRSALLTNIHCSAPKRGHQAKKFQQF